MDAGLDLATTGEVTQREDEGQVVHMRDADGELAYHAGKPVTVRIAGSYSAIYRKTQAAQTQRVLRKRSAQITDEQVMANRQELVAACILPSDWQGWTSKGQPIPYSPANALLVARVPWFQAQLEEAQQDHAGFSSSSSAPSSPG